jgi:hypothetical protein
MSLRDHASVPNDVVNNDRRRKVPCDDGSITKSSDNPASHDSRSGTLFAATVGDLSRGREGFDVSVVTCTSA